jgi:hypothetical protein
MKNLVSIAISIAFSFPGLAYPPADLFHNSHALVSPYHPFIATGVGAKVDVGSIDSAGVESHQHLMISRSIQRQESLNQWSIDLLIAGIQVALGKKV